MAIDTIEKLYEETLELQRRDAIKEASKMVYEEVLELRLRLDYLIEKSKETNNDNL